MNRRPLVAAIAAIALLVTSAACESKTKPSPIDEPAIGLTLTPSSGKAPLVVEADINVTNGYSCRLVTIQGGIESATSDISCKVRVTRTFTSSGSVKVLTKDINGREFVRTEPVTVTP